MATTKHKAYGSITTALSTGLNSLANAASSAVSAEIDNSTALDLYMDLNLSIATQGSARSAGGYIAIYRQRAMDGTNYPASTNTTVDMLVAVFPLDAATTARAEVAQEDIPIPGGKFKLYLVNSTGQALASSGNLVEYVTHSIETV